jgi:outer membrane protein TolC
VKRNIRFIFLISFLSIFWLRQPVLASEMVGMEMTGSGAPATIELTLLKAEELALKGNPHIHAADKRVDAASKQSLQTLAPADPTFTIDETFANMTMWQVEENLGFPGQSFAQVDVDNAETGKQQAMAEDTRRTILRQTRQTFWDFYYRQKVYDVLDDSQKQWKSLSQVLKSRELTGQWLSMKTVRAQMEIANAANDLFTSSQALEVSKVNFNHLFSLPHETIYILKETPDLPPLDGTVETYIQTAMDENPMVHEAQKELDKAGAEAHVAALSHLPDFTVALSGTRNPEDTDFSYWGFRVGVSVPLFFPIKQTQATDQANDEVEASRYELTGAKNETTHMVEEAYVDAQSTWRLWKLYEEGGLLEQTQKAWRATESSYRNEQISLSDFVDNYSMYVDTLKSYYKAQADYGKALAELDYQMGNLPVSGNEKE